MLTSPSLQSEGSLGFPDEASLLLRLRPGAHIFEVSADELQISFPNYTATFTSSPVVEGLRALLVGLGPGGERGKIVGCAAQAVGQDVAFLDYLVDLLLQTNCLYSASSVQTDNPLAEFLAYLGSDPCATLDRLAQARPILIVPASMDSDLADVLQDAGLGGQVVPVEPGTTCGAALECIRACLSTRKGPLASWGFSYRLPFSRLLNDFAIEERIPILFGSCEGVTGRIGPYVIPRNTACLECTNLRLLSHAGEHEQRVFLRYRARYDDTIVVPDPMHPVFAAALLRMFVLELAEIVQRLPPHTLGALIEYSFRDGLSERHPIHKVPRCPACSAARPERLPWDAHFAAPTVKGDAQ
jgi:bacteriocin biosynthesis cyclodehydratase domain-containing protein